MSFEDEFPSLKGKMCNGCYQCGSSDCDDPDTTYEYLMPDDVSEFCLDKAKVKEAILKAEKAYEPLPAPQLRFLMREFGLE